MATLWVANTSCLRSRACRARRAVVAVERAERLDLLDFAISRRRARSGRRVLVTVPVAVADDHRDLLVGDERRGVAHLRDLVAHRGVGVVPQEVGQLHDVAVGVVERAMRWCVGHVGPVLRLSAQSVKR